jgi:hypothetical protein
MTHERKEDKRQKTTHVPIPTLSEEYKRQIKTT